MLQGIDCILLLIIENGGPGSIVSLDELVSVVSVFCILTNSRSSHVKLFPDDVEGNLRNSLKVSIVFFN